MFGDEGAFLGSPEPDPGEGGPTKLSPVIVRLGVDGALDPSFGDGRGFVRPDVGPLLPSRARRSLVGVMAGAVDPDGRPVFIASTEASHNTGCGGHPVTEMRPAAVVRLTESGQLDTSFGGGDGVSGPTEGSNRVALGLTGDGGVVVGAGRYEGANAGCQPGSVLYRLRPDGGRQRSFGADGRQLFSRFRPAFVEASGEIVMSNKQGSRLEVARLLPDGGRDVAFGSHGVSEFPLPVRVGLHVRPVAVEASGRILLAGFVGSRTGPPKNGQPRSSFVVGRLEIRRKARQKLRGRRMGVHPAPSSHGTHLRGRRARSPGSAGGRRNRPQSTGTGAGVRRGRGIS